MQEEHGGGEPSGGEPAPAPAAPAAPAPGAPPMTKSAAKKAAKRALREQRKQETKHERRAKERQRRKERRQLQRALEAKDPAAQARVSQRRPPAVPFDARVVVDLGFDDLMTEDEATSLAAQLGYLYAVNRSSPRPFAELVFSGAGRISGRSLGFAPPHGAAHVFPQAGSADSSLFDERVGRHMEVKNEGSWRRWQRVRLIEHGGVEALWDGHRATAEPPAAEKTEAGAGSAAERAVAGDTPAQASTQPVDQARFVYLTADTDATITELTSGTTYIIGGIVDRNRYKYLCAKKAEVLGVPTARLPIDPAYLAGQRMSARKVLTVNQVFAILVGWTETRDWTQALQRGLPQRKFHTRVEADAEDEEAAFNERAAVSAPLTPGTPTPAAESRATDPSATQ